MPKLAFAAGALLAAMTAVPASAQITISGVGQGAGGHGLSRQLEQVRDRIEHARDDRRLSRDEARAYRREARGIGAMKARYARDGLSDAEIAELRFRIAALDGLAQAPSQPRRDDAGGR